MGNPFTQKQKAFLMKLLNKCIKESGSAEEISSALDIRAKLKLLR